MRRVLVIGPVTSGVTHGNLGDELESELEERLDGMTNEVTGWRVESATVAITATVVDAIPYLAGILTAVVVSYDRRY